MVNKYSTSQIFRDGKTKLVIPNLEIAITTAITNIVSSFVTNPEETSRTYFPSSISPIDFVSKNVSNIVSSILDTLIIGFGVTKIETTQDYVMPFSKGIGSTGEVIHLMGAKNEIINLEFKTDRYPGRLGFLFRTIVQKTLQTAGVVYLIDDLFLATPCLIMKSKISKEGSYRGAVMGELQLVSLATGANFVSNKLGGNKRIQSISKQLKISGATSAVRSSLTPGVRAGAGAFFIGATLVQGILGG